MPPSSHKARDPSERVAKRLLREGRITRELCDRALQHRAVSGNRFEESLIECGVREDQLLRQLAEMYRVQYISSQKLAAAVIPKAVLQLVPKQVARQRLVIPVLLDRKTSCLSLVTADPDDIEAIKEVEIASQVRTIKPLVARPAAVEAAIGKFYENDSFAFAVLSNRRLDAAAAIDRDPITQMQTSFATGEDVSHDSALDLGLPHSSPRAQGHPPTFSHPPISAKAAPRATPPQPAAPIPNAPPRIEARSSGGRSDTQRVAEARQELGLARELSGPEHDSAPRAVPVPPALPPEDTSPLPPTIAPDRASAEQSGVAERAPPSSPDAPDSSRRSGPPGRQTVPGAKLESIGDPFQMALVLVSLMEGNRSDLRSHSVQTARLVRKVCERFSVPGSRARAAEIAALIHDLGKASGGYHLTPYNVAQFDGHQTAARKLYFTPARVLESARLAKAAINAVTHMYERYDGKGFPAQLRGPEIPLESRILAICDSYGDLTSNPRNSFRRVLTAQDACEALREKQGTVFDPKVVDRFTRVVLGDELAHQLQNDRGSVLVVDPDVEETTVLELALLEQRYDVHVARSQKEALAFLGASQGVDLIISEVELGPDSGLDLLRAVRSRFGDAIRFVFFSENTDSEQVSTALTQGAADYLFKPLSGPVVAAKIRHVLEQARREHHSRGVSGSLEEMSLPDIVQIMHQGRKSGKLKLTSGGKVGEVFFKEGAIVDARWQGTRGEEAFYALVGVSQGEFNIDPEAEANETSIQMGAEMLLLEGMRRLDEATR